MRLYTLLLVLFAVALPASASSVRLKDIQYADGVVSIHMDGPVEYETEWWKSGRKFSVDLKARGIDLALRELSVNVKPLENIRWNQRTEDTIRVVLDLTTTDRPVMLSSPGTNPIQVRVTPEVKSRPTPPPPVRTVSKTPPPTRVATVATTVPDAPSPAPAVPQDQATLRDIKVEMDGQNRPSRILILTDKPVAAQPGWWTTRLFLDFLTAVNGPRERIVPVNDPDLIRVRSGNYQGSLRVTLDLRRRVGYKISSLTEETGVAVDLLYPSEPIDPNAPPFVEEEMPRPKARALNEMLIVLDPGHGGWQAGARGKHILEKTANLDISLRLARVLESKGARVVLTRSTDVAMGLRDRPAVAMRLNADVFVSIHCNSSPVPSERSKGTEVFYRRNDAEARRLAKCLYDAHREKTGLTGRRVKPDSSAPQGGLAVLKNTTVPAALMEVAFINHKEEGRLLADPDWRQKVAEGMADGLQRYAEGQE